MVEGWDPYENIPTTTAKAVEKIHELAQQDTPFFMYFSFPSPHEPIIPNDEFDGRSGAGPYGDFVVETDEACGTILAALKETGMAENTIVIFSSDNGAEYYAYERDAKFGHWSSEPLRGLKRDIYEGGHRVPFIVRWPGVVPAGTVSDALVSQIDLMGTFAAILDYEIPAGHARDSFNLLPVLRNENAVIRTSHVHNTHRNYAIRSGDWLLIDAETGITATRGRMGAKTRTWEKRRGYEPTNQPVQLYNLSEDLEQRHNLAEQYPDGVVHLQKLLEESQSEGYPDLPPR